LDILGFGLDSRGESVRDEEVVDACRPPEDDDPDEFPPLPPLLAEVEPFDPPPAEVLLAPVAGLDIASLFIRILNLLSSYLFFESNVFNQLSANPRLANQNETRYNTHNMKDHSNQLIGT